MTALRPLFALLLLAACQPSSTDGKDTDTAAGDTDATTDTTDTDVSPDTDASTTTPGADFDLNALSAHVFFTGADNQRTVDADASFPPASETFESVRLDMTVSCPAGGRCDPWDRLAWFGVVLDKGTESERVLELTRFITPYGVGDTWSLDVTDLRPLLTGDVTLRVFIDTWVGPGSSYGDGWQVDAQFVGKGGTPPRNVLGVLPVYPPTYVVYGDPARSIATQLPEAVVALPDGTTRASLRTFITGHGQGNAGNCAEFCEKRHALDVGGAAFTQKVWRDNCRTTGAPNQQGSWTYARAGWCPGAEVLPWVVDVDAPDPTLSVRWDVAPYENTCRPDASTCTGCSLGTGCDFDRGNHTEPNYQVGAALIAYGEDTP